MAKKQMFFSSAKAIRELNYRYRLAENVKVLVAYHEN